MAEQILPYWKDFCDFRRDKVSIDPELSSKLNRFRARHRLATKFSGIQADGISEQALRGYAAGIKLMLSYSAAEALGNALGENVKKWEMIDQRFALSLRVS
jgi:hypothetical protein